MPNRRLTLEELNEAREGGRLNDDEEGRSSGADRSGQATHIHPRIQTLKVIREVEAAKSQAQVAREYQITENTISKWRRQHRQYQESAFAGRGHAYTDEARMHELERMVGRLTMENDFLKKLLLKLESES